MIEHCQAGVERRVPVLPILHKVSEDDLNEVTLSNFVLEVPKCCPSLSFLFLPSLRRLQLGECYDRGTDNRWKLRTHYAHVKEIFKKNIASLQLP